MEYIQDQTKPTTPSGSESLEVHICHRCQFPFPNPHPNSKLRRAHKRICGTIEGYAKLIVDSEADSDDDHHSGSDDEEEVKTPSPKTEKRIIKESGSSAGGIEEKSNRSEDDMFSDAVTEFSDTRISPGATSEVNKVDVNHEVFESPIAHSEDADEAEENDTKHSIPLVENTDGSHKDKVIDQMSEVSGNKDQGEDVHELSVASDIPLVDKAETLIQDFKDHNVSYGDKHAENRSMVDIFEFKTVQERVQERQTSEHKESAFVVPTVVTADSLSEPEASHDKHKDSIKFDHKIAESVVSDSKDSVKAGSSETLVDEGRGKLLTGQYYGVDTSVCSSSNSLEGNWGSVSEIQNAFGKLEISDDRSRLGRSDAFEGLSLVESEEEVVEQKASEIKVNEEAIAKVANWSTSEAKSSNPKQLANLVKKDEDAEKASQLQKSNPTRDTPEVNQESSAQTYGGEGKKVEKKTKEIPSWVQFLCCSTSIRR